MQSAPQNMKTHTSSTLLGPLSSSITDILITSGAAGASIGVLDGRTGATHVAGYGYRDINKGLVPDEHTVYHLASLSKSFTAIAIALLVADEKLLFVDHMRDILPTFHHSDETVASQSTVLDFLSHRTGLASKNALWQQDGHELLLEQSDTVPMVSYLEVIEPLGSRWNYNNWNYDILADVIEAASGTSWAAFVSERILAPLGLHETTTDLRPQTENWARGYMPDPDCEFTDVGRPVIAGGTVQQGANGVKSTVNDLLIYYKATLDAWRSETASKSSGLPTDTTTPLKNIRELLTPHIPLDADANPDVGGQWYGAGWAIAELPAPLGSIGTNGMFVPAMPLVGRGCDHPESDGNRTTVWYHNGSLVGFFSSVHVLPDTGTIIVVLVNSIPKNDCADWIGQMIVEEMLQCPERNDYKVLARESAAAYDHMWKQLKTDLNQKDPKRVATQPLSEYAGRYFNKLRNWFIEVTNDAKGLQFSFQGRRTQTHRLQLHGIDIFSWPLTEAQSRSRGRWPDLEVPTYLFHFGFDGHGRIAYLRWEHDPDVPGGETFSKVEETSKFESGRAEL